MTPLDGEDLLAAPPSAGVIAAHPLDAVYELVGQFVVFPSKYARDAVALWITHAHVMDAWESTPRLAVLSPEPSSGKTRLLEILNLLVPRPEMSINSTISFIFRTLSDPNGRPTLLFDEVDTIYGPKANGNEELRAIINSGHRRGATVGRVVAQGNNFIPERFPVFGAVAMAGLDDLPDTIMTRSIVIRMRRRSAGERVKPYQARMEPEGHKIRDQLAAWANTVERAAMDHVPEMPEGVEDRDADVWEALLTVADLAGGDWPARSRAAAVALVAESKAKPPSLGVRLLGDLRKIFGDADHMFTEDILDQLKRLSESPWAELKGGKPLDARGLAYRLGKYQIQSKQVRIGEITKKGYAREEMADAWVRYLPPPKDEPEAEVQQSEFDRMTGG